jgi:cytochrome c oxidase subunit II
MSRLAAAAAVAGLCGALCGGASARTSDPLEVRVTGAGYQWTIRYAGPDGRLDTADDVVTRRHLHLPARSRVRLELASEDFVYSFSLPALDVSDLAVPGRPFLLMFETESAGTSRVMGDQMCGFTHPELMGDLIVQRPEEFQSWLAQQVSGK